MADPAGGALTNDERQAALRRAYDSTKDHLMEILYEEDPDGIGSTVSAPLDEYSYYAAHLMAALRGAKTESEVREVLAADFANVSDQLVLRIHEAWVQGGGPEW